jgi:hypothetical protein
VWVFFFALEFDVDVYKAFEPMGNFAVWKLLHFWLLLTNPRHLVSVILEYHKMIKRIFRTYD